MSVYKMIDLYFAPTLAVYQLLYHGMNKFYILDT